MNSANAIASLLFLVLLFHAALATNLFVHFPLGIDAGNMCNDNTRPCGTLDRALQVATMNDTIFLNYQQWECKSYTITTTTVLDFSMTRVAHNVSACDLAEFFLLGSAFMNLTIQHLSVTAARAPLVRSSGIANSNIMLRNITWSYYKAPLVQVITGQGMQLFLNQVLVEKSQQNFTAGVLIGGGVLNMKHLSIEDTVFDSNLGYAGYISNVLSVQLKNSVIRYHSNTRVLRIFSCESVFLSNLTTLQNHMGGISIMDGKQVRGVNLKAIGNSRNDGQSRGGAALSISRMDVVNISDSFFYNNEGNKYGGAAFVSEAEYVSFINCTFDSNAASGIDTYSGGGGLYTNSSTTLVLNNCLFVNNTSDNFGGGAYAFEVDYATITYCKFLKNSANKGGGARAFKMMTLTVENCEFSGNFVSQQGAALLLREVLLTTRYGNTDGAYIRNTLFLENKSSQDGGAITLVSDNNMHINNCKFIKNVATNGGAIHLSGNAVAHITQGSNIFIETEGVTIENTIFERNVASKRGAAVLSSSTEIAMVLIACTFEENVAEDGAGMYSLSRSTIVKDSMFKRNKALKQGGCIYSSQSTMKLNNVQFYGCIAQEGSAMHCNGRSLVTVTNSSMTYSFSNTSTFTCLDSDCTIQNSYFARNNVTADCAGATVKGYSKFLASSVTWERNSANAAGGAFCVDQTVVDYTGPYAISLTNVSFINNNASKGGALSVIFDKQLQISDAQFVNNIADIGGSVFVFSSISSKSTFDWRKAKENKNITFISSSASLYGDEFASNPVSIALHSYGYDANVQNIVTPENRTMLCYPGQSLYINLVVTDIFEQEVIDFPGFFTKVMDGKYIVQASSLEQSITFGRVSFNDVNLFSKIGTTVDLNFKAYDNFDSDIPIYHVPVLFVTCPAGFAIETENKTLTGSDRDRCKRCEEGFYSIVAGEKACNKCPENAYCFFNSVVSNKGYWTYYDYVNTSNSYSKATVHYCLNQRCAGNNKCENERNSNAPLCAACSPGFSEWNGSCFKCDTVNAGFFILFLFFLIGLTLLEHISSQTRKTASFKILFFYGQTMTLIVGTTDFISWVRMLFEFEFVFMSSNSTEGCPYPRDSYLKLFSSFIQSMSLYGVLLIMLIITSIIRCLTMSIRKTYKVVTRPKSIEALTEHLMLDMAEDKLKAEKAAEGDSALNAKVNLIKDTVQTSIKDVFLSPDAYLISCIGLLVLSYQELAKTGFSYFACMRIGSERYLYHSTDIRCFSPEYFRWYDQSLINILRMPFYVVMMVYAVFFPFALLIFLLIAKRRKWLYNDSFAHIFGNLYMPYKPQYYWFESFALFRRTVIIASWVASQSFVQDRWPGAQFNVIAVLLMVLLFIQRRLRPYIIHSENIADEYAILVLILVALVRASYSFEQRHLFSQIFLMIIAIGMAIALFIWAMLQNAVVRKLLRAVRSLLVRIWQKIRKQDAKQVSVFESANE